MKTFLTVLLSVPALLIVRATAQQAPHSVPTVLIRGDGNVVVSAAGIGVAAAASASKHDQTMEMARQLLKHCPEITLTVGEDQPADYVLLLNREGGGFFDAGDSQLMLVRGSDKMVLYANKQGTVARAMKDGCKAIMRDWKQTKELAKRSQPSRPQTSSAQDPAPSKNWWNVDKKPESTLPR